MLDSTTISGNVLAKLPFGKFIKMLRYNSPNKQGIAVAWYQVETPGILGYFDVLTGEPIQQKYIEEQ